MNSKTLAQRTVDELDNILKRGNIKEKIIANHDLIRYLDHFIMENPTVIQGIYRFGGDSSILNDWMFDVDENNAHHSLNVAQISMEMVKYIGEILPDYPLELQTLGFYHDLGKLVIPPELKNKEGRLETFEKEMLTYGHVLVGEAIARACELPDSIVNVTGSHHDRMYRSDLYRIKDGDGSNKDEYGYPHKNPNQTDETKVVQIADSTQLIYEDYSRVIQVADVAQAMKDPSRRNNGWFKENGIEAETLKKDADRVVMEYLVRCVMDEVFEKKYVKAYFKAHNLSDGDIATLFSAQQEAAQA